MKLLFDQNGSPKLVRRLADLFPDSNHVFYLDLDRADDDAICRFAFSRGFAIVTKDVDYSEMPFIKRYLPKIIWIRKGNCSNADIEGLLRKHVDQIDSMEENETVRILILF